MTGDTQPRPLTGCERPALAATQHRLLSAISAEADRRPPEQALHAALAATVDLAVSDPARARALMSTTLSGPRPLMDVRDAWVARTAHVVDRRLARADPLRSSPDVASRGLVGGVQRLLAARLRDGTVEPDLTDGLASWLDAYAVPAGEHRWRELTPAAPPSRWPYAAPPAHAALADADTRALFGQAIAVTAGAFATGRSWPERVWQGARALTDHLQANPSTASLALVENAGRGGGRGERGERVAAAFTIFLQEGARGCAQAPRRGREDPSTLVVDAIAASVFELCYLQARAGRTGELPGLLPHIVFLVLAPFNGAGAANGFLEQMTAEFACAS